MRFYSKITPIENSIFISTTQNLQNTKKKHNNILMNDDDGGGNSLQTGNFTGLFPYSNNICQKFNKLQQIMPR